MNGPLVASPFGLRVSDDPDGDRHAKSRHPIENVASDLRFGRLISQRPSVKMPTDDCFVAIHRGFDQAPAVVARAALPADAPVLSDGLEMSVALCCRGLVRNGRRPRWDNDRSLGMTFGNGIVNGFTIIRAVCRQRRNVSIDLIEQFGKLGKVAGMAQADQHQRKAELVGFPAALGDERQSSGPSVA